MKHKWLGFVIALVICLSSVLVAIGAVSFFSKKQPASPSIVLPNEPTESGIYISADSFLQNTATQNQTNLFITYSRYDKDGVLQVENATYTDRFSVNYGDTVKFTITATNGYYIQSITTGAVDETLTQFVADSSIKSSNMRSYMLNKSTNDTNTVTEIECQYANDADATYEATYDINNIEKSQHFSAESAQHVWSLTIPQSSAFLVSLISVNGGEANTSTNANGSITIANITYSSEVEFKIEATKINDPAYRNIYKYQLTKCAWENNVYQASSNFIKNGSTSIEEEDGTEHVVQYTKVYNRSGFFRGNNTLSVGTEELQTNITIPNFNTLSNYINFYVQIKNEDGSVAQNWKQATTGEFEIFVGQTFTLTFSPKYKSQGNGYYISSMLLTRNSAHAKTYTNVAFNNSLISTSWSGFINGQDVLENYFTKSNQPTTDTSPSSISVQENVLHTQSEKDSQVSTLQIHGLYGSVKLEITCNQYVTFEVLGGLTSYVSTRPELQFGWKFENLTYIEENGQSYFQYTPTNEKFPILYHTGNKQFVFQLGPEKSIDLGEFSAIAPYFVESTTSVPYPSPNQGCSYIRYQVNKQTYTINIQYAYPANGVGAGLHNETCYILTPTGELLTSLNIALTEAVITGGYNVTLTATPNYDITVYFSAQQVIGNKPNEEDILSQYTTNISGGEQKVVHLMLTDTKSMYLYVEYTPKAYEILFETPQTGSSDVLNMPNSQTWYYRCFIQQTTGYLPQAKGYTFMGFYTQPNGQGVQMIDAQGNLICTEETSEYLSNLTSDGQFISSIYWVGENNTTLYAYWEPKTINFQYQMASVGTSIISVQIPSSATEVSNPRGFKLLYDTVLNGQTLTASANGYTYLGMYVILQGKEYALTDAQGNFLLVPGVTQEYQGEIVFAPTNVNTTMQLIAKWQANLYTIRFDIEGIGNDPYQNTQATIEIMHDASLQTKVNVPTTIGYTFAGWYYGDEQIYDAKGNLVASNSLISSGNWHYANHVTLTSKWVAKEFTLNFIINNAGLKDKLTFEVDTTSVKLTYNTSYTLPNATSAGYNFLGWIIGEQLYQAGDVVVFNFETLGEEWFMQEETSAVAQWQIKTFQAPVIENLEFGSITFDKSVYEYGDKVIITFTPNEFYYVNKGISLQGKTIHTVSVWNENLSANITFEKTTNLHTYTDSDPRASSNAIVGQSNNTYIKTITIDYLLSDIVLENAEGFFAQQTYQVQVIDAYRQSFPTQDQLALYTKQQARTLYSIPNSVLVPSHYRLEFTGWVIQSTNTKLYYNFVDHKFNLAELTENAYAKDFTDLQQLAFTLSTNVVISATYEIALKQSASFYYFSANENAYVWHEEQFAFDENNCIYINYNINTRKADYVEKVNGETTEKEIYDFTINDQNNLLTYQGQVFEAYFKEDSNGVKRFDLVTDLTVDLPVESTSFLPDASLTWAGWVYFKEPQNFETYLLLTEDGVMCGERQVEVSWFTDTTRVDDQFYVYQVYKKKGV